MRLVYLAVIFSAVSCAQQALAPGLTLKGTLEAQRSVSHAFQALAPDTFVSASIDCGQTPIRVTIRDGSGQSVAEVEATPGQPGFSSLSAILPSPGAYRLELSALGVSGATSYYEVQITHLRPAGNGDSTRLKSQTLLAPILTALFERSSPRDGQIERRIREYGDLCASSSDPWCTARHWYFRGYLSLNEDQNQQAVDAFTRAVTLLANEPASSLQVGLLHNRGVAWRSLGDFRRSAADFAESVRIAQSMGSRYLEAESLLLCSVAARDTGDTASERKYLYSAIDVALSTGLRMVAAQGQVQLGRAWDGSEPERTASNIRAAIETFRTHGYRLGQAIGLAWLARVLYSTSEYEGALEAGAASAKLHREAGNVNGEASILPHLAAIYARLGDQARAAAMFERAIELQPKDDQGATARLKLSLAGFRSLTGEREVALRLYKEVVSVAAAIQAKREHATALLGLARLNASHDPAGAAQDARTAAAMFASMDDRRMEAEALRTLAGVLPAPDERLALYRQALAAQLAVRDHFGAATTELEAGQYLRRLGRKQQAKVHLASALDRAESQRSSIRGPGLRMTYFTQLRQFYDAYVDLLMELYAADAAGGHEWEAFHVHERSRARVLLDALVESGVNRAVNVSPEWEAEERRLRARITKLAGDPLLSSGSARSPELENLLAEYSLLEGKLSPAGGPATQVPSAQAIASALPGGAAVLEYRLGREGSYAWLLQQGRLTTRRLPGADELNRLAADVAAAQTGPDTVDAEPRYRAAARRLSDAVLKPVLDQIKGTTLIVIGDGELQRISFGALPLPEPAAAPLIERFEVVQSPSAAVYAATLRKQAGQSASKQNVLVFADPVFAADDERLAGMSTQGAPKLPRLRSTEAEAEVIRRIVGVERTQVLKGFDATVATATSEKTTQFQTLHFATHALTNPEYPELSGIALSHFEKDGRPLRGMLRTLEIYRMSLASRLVILSACRGADGKDVGGEGLAALARAFLYAGSTSVLAAVTPVGGRFPVQFMQEFYSALATGATPAKSLRQAQLKLFRQGYSARRWGAFVLIGS